jgi:hypothetical protein
MSQNRNWNSSLLTKVKGSRTVFANNLTQNAAVNAGRRLAVTAVSGSGSDNSFTLAIQKGSVNLTPAEYEAAIEAGSGSGPGPQRILFAPSSVPKASPLPSGYTVPAGYTSILFVLIGRGEEGNDGDSFAKIGGEGGRAGQIVIGTLSITAGDVVSIGEATTGIQITVGARTITAFNGNTSGGAQPSDITVYEGGPGEPGTAIKGGNGGALATLIPISNLPFGGGGGGGGADGATVAGGIGVNGGQDGNASDDQGGLGGPSFYAIQLTPPGYTGPNLFSL